MIDYITVSQEVKAGNPVYVFQESAEFENTESSKVFDGLDFSNFDNYAYQIDAKHFYTDPTQGSKTSTVMSEYAGRQLVDPTKASVPAQTLTGLNTEDCAPAVYYDLMGRRVAEPRNGVFVKVQNGKATKVRF